MKDKIYHLDIETKDTLIHTFSFDHNLKEEDLISLEENTKFYEKVNHIYFKEEIDIENIDKVRTLIETSNTLDDEKIEKYILIDYSNDELEKLLEINYLSPDTWHISYKRTDGIKDIYTITECRRLKDYFDKKITSSLKKLSQLEQIGTIYDIVKLLDYKDEKNTLLEINETNKTNSYGYNLLFQELLNRINISSYIEEAKSTERRYLTAIDINDDKYKINGIYLFDPFMDSIPSEEYEGNLRKINYNYFCLSFNKFHNTKYKDALSGILKIFYHINEKMFKDHLEEIKLFDDKYIEKLNKTFKLDYIELYNKIKSTDDLEKEVLFTIIKEINTNQELVDLIEKNYDLKQEEMYEE